MPTSWNKRTLPATSTWEGRASPGQNPLEVIETGTWNDAVNWQESSGQRWWDAGGTGTGWARRVKP